MSKCDCTDSYICELCMPDTIDELATLKARNSALERVAERARTVCKVYWDFEKSMKAEIQALEQALAALDAEGEKV